MTAMPPKIPPGTSSGTNRSRQVGSLIGVLPVVTADRADGALALLDLFLHLVDQLLDDKRESLVDVGQHLFGAVQLAGRGDNRGPLLILRLTTGHQTLVNWPSFQVVLLLDHSHPY